MANLYAFFCFALFVIGAPKSEANPFSTANATIDNMVNLITELGNEKSLADPSINKTFLNIHSGETEVYEKLQLILRNSQQNLGGKIKKLYQYFSEVEKAYEQFVDFFKNFDKYNGSSKIFNWVQDTTSDDVLHLQATVENMYRVFIVKDKEGESIVSSIAEKATISDAMHLNQTSVQQLIYALYETVAAMHTKAFVTTVYCYNLREIFELESFEYKKNKLRFEYSEKIWNTFHQVKWAMHVADKTLIKADPRLHREGITYSKLYPVLQGAIIRAADTNAGGWYTFWHTCEALTSIKLQVPDDNSCPGLLRDCQYIGRSVDVCRSSIKDRLYSWAVTGSLDIYGQKTGECRNKAEHLDATFPYEVCLCTCESEYVETDRYFSLQDVTADPNKAITGVRLVKKGNVFYIQIQQGTLGANYSIIGEPEWKPVKEESPIDLHRNKNVFPINYDQNTVFLDDMGTRSWYVLTGLRFQKTEENNLRLESQLTSFNYTTGESRHVESWFINPNLIDGREEVVLVTPDDPTVREESTDISYNNRYVKFRMSDLHKDLGQTLVPYIDTQEIVTNPPMPLAGAGLYHKGRKYSGGFLGIKLHLYDFTEHP